MLQTKSKDSHSEKNTTKAEGKEEKYNRNARKR